MNALNKDLAVGLNEAPGRLDADQEIDVVVIAGAGRAFCAGGDLGVIGAGREKNDLSGLAIRFCARACARCFGFARCGQPVIAAVHGARRRARA